MRLASDRLQRGNADSPTFVSTYRDAAADAAVPGTAPLVVASAEAGRRRHPVTAEDRGIRFTPCALLVRRALTSILLLRAAIFEFATGLKRRQAGTKLVERRLRRLTSTFRVDLGNVDGLFQVVDAVDRSTIRVSSVVSVLVDELAEKLRQLRLCRR